ncbi:MAG: UDP-4-amino-4,6-dideoxy-N-acetyl-beta-L-altrosamine transaminase [Cypionkella sp.]
MIPYGRHYLDEDDIKAVTDLMRSGASLTQGPKVEEFERAVADYVGAKYAVAVSSATAGLHIAAVAAGVKPGAALVTSPITFIASSNAALYAGGTPLFADIDTATVNMSPASLAAVLRAHPETKAIVPVHFGGLPCDMPAIRAEADKVGAVIIEDAAHALGGHYPDGSKIGSNSHGHMTVFSFHPVKAVAAGEGGIVTTNDEGYYRHMLRLRSHGINKLDDPFELPDQAGPQDNPDPWYYEMQELGFHYRITDIQCALALSQLGKLDRFIARRRQLAEAYDAAFADFSHLRPAQAGSRELSGHHLYVLRIKFDEIGVSRAELMRKLRERDIGSQVHYIPVPAQPVYRKLQMRPEDYPNSMDYYGECLSIPLFYSLTDEQQQDVVAALRELVG